MKAAALRALILSVVLAGPASVSAQPLADVVRTALAGNPDVLSALDRQRAAVQDLSAARSQYLPTADVVVQGGYEISDNTSTRGRRGAGIDAGSRDLFRRQGTLLLSQILFDGFQIDSQVERQIALLDSEEQRVRRAREQVTFNVVQAYLEITRQREILVLARKNVEAHEAVLRQVDDLTRSGRGREVDLHQARGRLALARTNVDATLGRLRDAEANFVRAVGEMPADTTRPKADAPKDIDTAEAAVALAAAGNSALEAARRQTDAQSAFSRELESPWYPKVTAEVAGTKARDIDGVSGDRDSASALLVFRYNLYRGGGDEARLRAQKERVSGARNFEAQVLRQIEENARIAFNALTTASARLPSLREYAEATVRVRDAYRVQFSVGQRTLLDLLDSENELFVAQSNQVNGELTELLGIYQLLFATNRILAELAPEYAAPP